MRLFAFILVFPLAVLADPIQSTNRIDWVPGYTVGVTNGIPEVTTVYTNFTSSASAANINKGIADCPSNQVVLLAAGTYTLTASIDWGGGNNGVVLRGAGISNTIINSSADPVIKHNDYAWFGDDTGTSISSGATKGSTQIVVASGTSFAVNELMQIDCADDTNFVFQSAGVGRALRTTHITTGVSGTTINFWPPLPFTYANSPKAYPNGYRPSAIRSGIESMTLNSTAAANSVIDYWNAYGCWVTNVEVKGFGNAGIQWNDSLNIEVRGCIIHDVDGFPANADGFGVYAYHNSSFNLVEDNIFYNVWSAVFQSGSSGNAWLYNFVTNCNSASSDRQQHALNANHGAHPLMCLWEGNSINQWENDAYHGSSSHQVIFRNWIHGLETDRMRNVKLVDVGRGCYYHSVIGNVLASSGVNALGSLAYQMTGVQTYTSMPVIYRSGYPNSGNNDLTETVDNQWQDTYSITYPDSGVTNTMLLEGNYDSYTDSQVWSSGSLSLSNSYAYTSKPAYWGNLTWPAYDPASPGNATIDDIPAGYRFLYGTNPPASGSSATRSARVSGTMKGYP